MDGRLYITDSFYKIIPEKGRKNIWRIDRALTTEREVHTITWEDDALFFITTYFTIRSQIEQTALENEKTHGAISGFAIFKNMQRIKLHLLSWKTNCDM